MLKMPAEVAAQTFLWRAIRDAGDQLRAAIDGRDLELLARAMARLDGAQRAAHDVFAAAFRLTDTPETGG